MVRGQAPPATTDTQTLEKLAPTVAPLNADAMADAARRITDLYLEIGPEMASAAAVEYPRALVERMVERIETAPYPEASSPTPRDTAPSPRQTPPA